jgi:2-polyprenyl-6-methoxyphenol hydroxylase-like FAD-dependent oxidoreductase
MTPQTVHQTPGAGRLLGQHAIVIGGSMAGLLTARVLADHFHQVTIIERDQQPNGADPRKGVPQGRHAHGLLGRGQQLIEGWFPGLFEDLVGRGALYLDMARDMRWYQFGQWKRQFTSGLYAYTMSRPLLEATIRERVVALPNVQSRYECAVHGLVADGARVSGVRLQQAGAPEETLTADLVVDASGRGSQAPQWLTALGYPAVEETLVKMGVGYTSRIYHRPADLPADWQPVLVYPIPPAETRLGAVTPIEGDRMLVSLSGWHGDHAPTDDAGFLQYMRDLPVPDLYEAVKDWEPLTAPVVHKIPANQRRHYDRMARFPEQFIVLGDALCAFNPIYGQGMTTAALDVQALAGCLRDQARRHTLTGLSRRFQRRAAKVISQPWLMATAEDFRYPQTTGARPPGLGIFHRYGARLFDLSATDPKVFRQFLLAMNMLASPAALFSPAMIWRVLSTRGSRLAATVRQPAPASLPEDVYALSTR